MPGNGLKISAPRGRSRYFVCDRRVFARAAFGGGSVCDRTVDPALDVKSFVSSSTLDAKRLWFCCSNKNVQIGVGPAAPVLACSTFAAATCFRRFRGTKPTKEKNNLHRVEYSIFGHYQFLGRGGLHVSNFLLCLFVRFRSRRNVEQHLQECSVVQVPS